MRVFAVFRKVAIKRLLTLLALLPAAHFAYLGSFSRMLEDDFVFLQIGRELGPWGSMLHWRDFFWGSYSDVFLHGLVAPVHTLMPPIMPTIIILIWFFALVWLVVQWLSFMRIERNRLSIAIAVSALTVAVAINAFYVPQSFFWYSASVRYVLPLPIFLVFLAAALQTATRSYNSRSLALIGVISAAICSASAGLSEMYMVFQLALLTLVSLFVFLSVGRDRRSPLVILLGAGWLGTFASFIVQATAPGVAQRMISLVDQGIWSPIRDLSELLSGTVELTLQHLGHQAAFAGFMMLMALAMFVTLNASGVDHEPSQSISFRLARWPLWLGLIVQGFFALFLWSHVSDNPLVFGRFSPAFMAVVSINAALIAVLVFLLWKRERVALAVRRNSSGLFIYCGVMFTLMFSVFALTQLRIIHFKAATFLFGTAMVILCILCEGLLSVVPDKGIRRWGLYAVMWLLTTLLCIAALAAASLVSQGGIQPRIMAAVAFTQVVGGLFWGSFLGLMIKRVGSMTAAGTTWITRLRLLSFAIVLIICIGMVNGHAKSTPHLAAFAEEWDERHQLLLNWRDSGRQIDEVPPLTSIDIAEYFCCSNSSSAWQANFYYGS